MSTLTKIIMSALTALLTGLCIAAPAAEAQSEPTGRNGLIAFTSGREGADDKLAQLYTVRPDGTGLSEPYGIAGTQNRHPSFSPDRTKVVFAAGTPGSPTTEEFDLFVHDFVTGQTTPMDGNMLGDNLTSDHPAWSPDGTRIAFTTQTVDNSADRDVVVKQYPSSKPPLNLTATAATEFKPEWSPDSKTVYYSKTVPGPPVNHDIVSRPATGGAEAPVVATPGDDFQPAISPDGSRICFTLQTTAGNAASGEVAVAPLSNTGNRTFITNDGTKADYNCSWSPDGFKVAFASGAFSQGALVTARADGSDSIPTPVTDDAGSNNFDGNPDWLDDGSPECEDQAVSTKQNTPITLELECTDTGPAYELSDPNGTFTMTGRPVSGALSNESPLSNPSTVVYTPNPGFSGKDRVIYTAFDAAGFGSDEGTITITVTKKGGGDPDPEAGRCAGRDVTIAGTPGADVLRGTAGPDVINAGAGKDRVRGGRGNDVICGKSGKDRLSGGAGKDRIKGGGGKDRIKGGGGKDRCAGGPGKDRTRTCEA